MNTYANLAALAKPNVKFNYQWYRHYRLEKMPNGDIELFGYRSWNQSRGKAVVTISPDNVATYHTDRYDITLNLVLGQLGLGAIARNTTVAARLLFCYNGKRYVYTPGMRLDLLTGDVVGAALAFDDAKVDAKARNFLLKLIRGKIPQASGFLRVAGVSYRDVEQIKGALQATPKDFVDAVRHDKTQLIAAIPLANLNYCKARSELNTAPLCACYGAALKAYIDQNRSLIYQAGGVVKSGATDKQGALL
jgi:hypothetical protein